MKQQQQLFVNAKRLEQTIETFADYGRTEQNGVTRLTLSEQDIAVRTYWRACCEELGMTVTIDDLGCMYATLAGTDDVPPIVIGSHMDTVKQGGRFDGILGVLAGLEIVRTLRDYGIQPRIPIVVMNFTNEEGARFEPSMMASGVLAGRFDKQKMLAQTDAAGITFGEALTASGYAGDEHQRIRAATAYLELHIEQGPVLEKEQLEIGLVDCVVGMVCYEIEVIGESNHAGTTPMSMRRDALFAANELMLHVHQQLAPLDDELVYTIGRMNVYPNIHTVIPNRVVFTLEARHRDEAWVRQVEQVIGALPDSHGGCTVQATRLWSRDTVPFNARVCELLQQAVQTLGYSHKTMSSGAGHDAQFVADFLPAAMVFVPSVRGKSHCEEEFTPYAQCAQGVNVLLETVMLLQAEG
ncbi:Zn-dependent hydrolase [Paenibacillus campi]|uniref:Zn-dependent hydrolase n=1 Tax=Paenibacillus campi TaxID=3106031 RepID=UPI002AFE3687|nr:Zn-dependent hydrolase [Paenibacillus sp. SGZ-1014]